LGAYRIPLETGLLIPSGKRKYRYSKEDTVQKQIRSAVLAAALAAIAAIIIAITWAPAPAAAQQQPHGVERKILRRQDLSMPGWETVMIETTMQPGGTEGWHTHPGTLVEYVLQGPWTMERRGKPTATYQTGETFSIPEGEVHQAINPGKAAVRGLAILIVDKSKPMTTQVH
jgi:quercetin dioxygenase-like cupin family protein